MKTAMTTAPIQPSAPSRAEWPAAIEAELIANRDNPRVGTRLLSCDDRVRVWKIRLKPGERIGFHRHVLDYFWTAVTSGEALSRQEDGTTVEARYSAGQTQHCVYGPGEYRIHDLENIGSTDLVFTTVEFMQSANTPLLLSELSAASA